MRPLVLTCNGCGVRIRTSRPEAASVRCCPRCQTPLAAATAMALGRTAQGSPDSAMPPLAVAETTTAVAESEACAEPARAGKRLPLRAGATTAALSVTGAVMGAAIVLALVMGPWWVASPRASARPMRPATASIAEPRAPAPPQPICPSPVAAAPVAADSDLAPILPIRTAPPPPPVPATESRRTPPPPKPAPLDSVVRFAPPLSAPSPVASNHVPPPPAPAGWTEPLPSLPPAATKSLWLTAEPKRVLVRDDAGRPVVSRVYQEAGDELIVTLPDGQLGWPEGRSYTEQPFRPATADELKVTLLEGPYRDFHVRQTKHYLIFYKCSETFATDSANLLESLYQGLLQNFANGGLNVHDAEFPLVAVIYDTEAAFRAAHRMPPSVQAFYHLLSNRIFLFQTSEEEWTNPEVAAIRKPQTIAHEGTHQILQNIGVQPRLSPWPIWLVEGLAEYCAPTFTRKGAQWAGIGKVNALHMATINDLNEQSKLQRVRGMQVARIGPSSRKGVVEDLIGKTELTPTDYATSWALTHYLASQKSDELLAYLRELSNLSPLRIPNTDDQVALFCRMFGSDIGKLDTAVARHLKNLKYESLPYYAVVFEQPISRGMVKRAALVSQSPSMIRQWIEAVQAPQGPPGAWRAQAYPSKTKALMVTEQWINGQ